MFIYEIFKKLMAKLFFPTFITKFSFAPDNSNIYISSQSRTYDIALDQILTKQI